MKSSIVYVSFFNIIGNFDVENILKFKENIVIITTKKTYPHILKKLVEGKISVIIVKDFKIMRKKIKRNKKYRIISSDVLSDRSINMDVE